MKQEKWFKNTVFYEIYVPSFYDKNEDGAGDLQGAASKIPYLKELGVSGIWLTPFYPSPRVDNGYDISNYKDVDKAFGTLEDFKLLLRTAHEAGIKVIIDMVLNHTSHRHPWFMESRSSIDNPYRDYYIWKKEVPNNWESFFDGSAWEYDECTGMYYYHAFAKEQVCLNWANPRVQQECLDVLKFWLEQGVDGFRMDVINFLKTDPAAFDRDNPVKDGKMEHLYDKNQQGIYEALRRISETVHAYPDKYLLGEVGENELGLISSYVGDGLLDSAFMFNLGSMEKLDAGYMAEQMMAMEQAGVYPTLFFSSHDMSRHINRLCDKDQSKAKLLAMFLLTAKGIPFLYQGEEMPLEDMVLHSPADIRDIQGRYGYEKKLREGADRETAFAYAKERSRDYSRGMIDWLDVAELDVGFFKVYQKLLQLRNAHPVLTEGTYGKIEVQGQKLYYQRMNGEEKLGIYLNFDMEEIQMSEGGRVYGIEDERGKLIGLIRKE